LNQVFLMHFLLLQDRLYFIAYILVNQNDYLLNASIKLNFRILKTISKFHLRENLILSRIYFGDNDHMPDSILSDHQ
jgi:hypothetical protein